MYCKIFGNPANNMSNEILSVTFETYYSQLVKMVSELE